jgi:hypothetical protein
MGVPEINALTKQLLGYEIFGYQPFHAAPDAAALIEAHVRRSPHPLIAAAS